MALLLPPLFHRYPGAQGLAWAPIMQGATPLRRLERFAHALGVTEIWLKDDSLSSPFYGGNKPRKLEFILADAKRLSAQRVMTCGGIGSNHCQATAIHAARAGLNVSLMLFPQPVTPAVQRSLLCYRYHGADILLVPEFELLEQRRREVTAEFLRAEGCEPYWIPLGGSSALGALGFVNAALELAEQIRAGEAPQPARIFVAAGTCGTLAGLALGCKLAGLRTRVAGVRVTPESVASKSKTVALTEEMTQLLRSTGASIPEEARIREENFDLLDGYFGEGYGHSTLECRKAVALMKETEGIALETTYTGKALAALIDAALQGAGIKDAAEPSAGAKKAALTESGRNAWRGSDISARSEGHFRAGGPLLFWNTFNAVDYWSSALKAVKQQELPADFQQFFQ
ncbi:MAG: pyridoxal-phosphate dependent enzyme [Candidatus Sumerlaeota bacterium]|nr:pyridoxal-phosphate dependent enzyme [Candidatus Sumerlaeota bacterium]